MDKLPQPSNPDKPIDPKTPLDPPSKPEQPVQEPRSNDRGIVEIDPNEQKERDKGAHVGNPWGPGGEPEQSDRPQQLTPS